MKGRATSMRVFRFSMIWPSSTAVSTRVLRPAKGSMPALRQRCQACAISGRRSFASSFPSWMKRSQAVRAVLEGRWGWTMASPLRGVVSLGPSVMRHAWFAQGTGAGVALALTA